MRTKANTLRSLQTIAESGGHLVLVERAAKRPVWSRWQRRKPSLDVVAAHDGRIGLVPYSIGATALDQDYGDPREMPQTWTRYKTPRGAHLYYGDHEARGNQKWQLGDCSGEVRGARGYLILHNGGADRVARALQSGRQLDLWPFPEDLLQLHEAELIVPTVRQLHAVEPRGKASVRLEGVYEGARNESLFLILRRWAYRQSRGADLREWKCRVQRMAFESNRRFPEPLNPREVLDTAYSVSTWVWSRLAEVRAQSLYTRELDHSPLAQSWRGTRSGEARRRGTQARDRAIVRAVRRGKSMRAVAGEHGITSRTVHWIVSRSLNPDHPS